VDQHDRERVVATVVAAFIADPVERWLWRDARDYLTHFAAFVAAFGAAAFEADAVSELDDFAAVALWMPPGAEPDGEAVLAVLRETVPVEQHEDTFALIGQMDDLHPTAAHWYLPWLAVDPSRQGAGLGGRLLARSLARVDADHLPAYLETPNPRTVPLYARHGFGVVGTAQAGTCPPITSMLRGAR
jgi:GNAT superfamily N-acetyltransferase